MTRAKEIMKKIATVIGYVYGYGIMICLFAGGLTFLGYIAALIIGGDVATQICTVIYKKIFPVIITTSTVMVLLGILKMYLSGETALSIAKKREKSKQKRKAKVKAKAEAKETFTENAQHSDVESGARVEQNSSSTATISEFEDSDKTV